MPQNGPRKMRNTDIDAHLKRAFQTLTDDTVPDRFASLLERLRTEEQGGATAGPAEGRKTKTDSTGAGDPSE